MKITLVLNVILIVQLARMVNIALNAKLIHFLILKQENVMMIVQIDTFKMKKKSV